MNIIDALLGEHAVFYAMFDQIESAPLQREPLAALAVRAAQLEAALSSHARLEEELLFSRLEQAIGPHGPLAVMRAEHEEIEAGLATFGDIAEQGDAVGRLRDVIVTARDHFAKEEQALYMMARVHLDDGDLERLGAQWAAMRQVSIG